MDIDRFGGIARLYGTQGLQHLNEAHFLVVGIGGVGTWAAEALARSGVGTITLADLDDICVTNINRQAHALQSTIGQSKTEVMAARLRDINPAITVHLLDDFIDPQNVRDYIDTRYDVILDCADTAHSKTAIIATAKYQKQLVVTVGSAGGKRDPRLITSNDLNKTVNDPLLAKVRSQLRRFHNYSRNPKRSFQVEAVYSAEHMVYPNDDGGVCSTKNFSEGETALNCSGGFGSSTMITGCFGFHAASRAIDKYLARVERRQDTQQD
ncbi:MAG: hypothetical protein RL336_376 [Pseudomonadota bacterium]